jgi:lysophospholipase L1-like esterase
MRSIVIDDVASPPHAGTRLVRRALIAAALAAGLLGGAGTPRADTSGDASDPELAGGWRRDWIGTWATALTPASPRDTGRSLSGFADESIRMIVQTSIGGDRVRIRLSNAYGESDMTVGHATVGRPAAPSSPDLDPRSLRALTFRGRKAVVIPAGDEVVSDPLPMSVAPLSQLAVTVYLPEATGPMTWHWIAQQTAFVYDGDHAREPGGAGHTATLDDFFLLAGVEVSREHRSDRAVLVLGDSIADGFRTTTNANQRWPDQLARRIAADRRSPRIGVLNLGLSGNAVSHDGDEVAFPEIGIAGVNRIETDVFPQPGVRTVIVALGINDIFRNGDPPEAIIAGLRQTAASLRQRGFRVLLATLGPVTGAPNWNDAREATRQAVNAYVRSTRDADGVVDADLALRDPAQPALMHPSFDSGDHVHPNDLGAAAIAGAVPLHLL